LAQALTFPLRRDTRFPQQRWHVGTVAFQTQRATASPPVLSLGWERLNPAPTHERSLDRPAAQSVHAMRVTQEVRRDWDLGDAGEPSGSFDPLPRVDRAHREDAVLLEGLLGPQRLQLRLF
jgi:hypothetical protein